MILFILGAKVFCLRNIVHYEYTKFFFFLILDKLKPDVSCDEHCPGLKCKMINNKSWLNCTCKKGYELKFTGQRRECVDIDECVKFPQHCSQQCTNTLGSFKCRCVDGYEHNSISNQCKIKGLYRFFLITPIL